MTNNNNNNSTSPSKTALDCMKRNDDNAHLTSNCNFYIYCRRVLNKTRNFYMNMTIKILFHLNVCVVESLCCTSDVFYEF